MKHDPAQMTTSATARLLGVSEATVRLMEQRGDLPATRTSTGVRLFDRAAVERLRKRRLARARQLRGELEPPDAA